MKCILPIIILLGAGCSKDIKPKPETRKDAPSLPSTNSLYIIDKQIVSVSEAAQAVTKNKMAYRCDQLRLVPINKNLRIVTDSAIKIKELESRIETLNAKVKELEDRNVQLSKEKKDLYLYNKELIQENKKQCERLADRDANTKTLLWLEKSQFEIYNAMTEDLPSECAKAAVDGYYQYFEENPVPKGINWVEDW